MLRSVKGGIGDFFMNDKDLNLKLVELFDLRKAKLRYEKDLTQKANEAQRDIRLLTVMFREGIPALKVKIDEGEYIVWQPETGSLLYTDGKAKILLEAASKEVRVKARPFLHEMVKQAKNFYL